MFQEFNDRNKLNSWNQLVISLIQWCILFPSSALDFGMTGEFKQELRDGFMEACLHLVNRDFDALAKDFVTLGYLYLFMFPCSY